MTCSFSDALLGMMKNSKKYCQRNLGEWQHRVVYTKEIKSYACYGSF